MTFDIKKLLILLFLIFSNYTLNAIESKNEDSKDFVESSKLQTRQNRDDMSKNLDSKSDSIKLNENKKDIENLEKIKQDDTVDSKDSKENDKKEDSKLTQEKTAKEQEWDSYLQSLENENREKKLKKETLKEMKNELIQEKKLRNQAKKEKKIAKINSKDYRRILFEAGIFSVPVPFFYTQCGIGFSNMDININKENMPNFNLAFGFNQQINIWRFYIGLRMQMSYEVAIKAIGENTNSFQVLGFHSSLYAGFYRFNAHIDLGYEILYYTIRSMADINDSSKGFVMAKHNNDGFGIGVGLGFIVSKRGSIDLGAKILTGINIASTQNLNPSNVLYTRVMLNYEFRF